MEEDEITKIKNVGDSSFSHVHCCTAFSLCVLPMAPPSAWHHFCLWQSLYLCIITISSTQITLLGLLWRQDMKYQ